MRWALNAAIRGPALWVLLAAFVVLMFNSGQRFAMGLVLKPMAEDLGWTRGTLSAAVSAFLVISALALPFAGRFVDRYGATVVLGVSVVVAGLATALMRWVDTPLQVFVLHGVIFALGSAGTSIAPVSVLVNRWFPARLGLANSVAISGMGVGQLIIVWLLAAWLAQLGWRDAFLWLGVLSVVIVLPLVLATGRPGRPEGVTASSAAPPRTGPVRMRDALRTPRIWLLFGIYALCGFHDFFMATHVVAFALDMGSSSGAAGNMLALMGLMGLGGVLLAGFAADRLGPVLPTAVCFVLRVLLFGALLWTEQPALIMVLALLFGATFWVTAPLTVVFVRDGYGTALLGTLAGSVTMVHHACGGLGAYLGALSFDRTGTYDSAFVLMLVTSLLAAALLVPLGRVRAAQ